VQGLSSHAERSVRCYYDEDGYVVVEGRLPPEQGALVMKALQAAGDALREAERDSREASDAPEAAPDRAAQPYPARQADALALLGETFLASGAAPLAAGERHLVTVHVDERVLRDEREGGRSGVDDGAALPPATVRRLSATGFWWQSWSAKMAARSTWGARRALLRRRCAERSTRVMAAAGFPGAPTRASRTRITSSTG
jgi:hypothetical protein